MFSVISCKKSDNTLIPNTLGGSPGNCAPVSFSGIFAKGVAINSSQTVTVQVDVKSLPSAINISTNIVNGIFFSNPSTNSSFTTLGVQNVVLGASGVSPLSSGTYNYTVTLYRSFLASDISSCSFSLTFN